MQTAHTKPRPISCRAQLRHGLAIGESTLQFLLQTRGEGMLVRRTNAVQHQAIDVDDHALHAQPRVSDSLKGRSRLAASWRAACSRCAIETGSWSSAARNAALSAMLRMLPPVMLSRASLLLSIALSGVRAGKALRQIASRRAWSGNGKCTTKRKRRWNAKSSAGFRLVVRMASPQYDSMRCSR